ncbi:MAG: response regulator [Deltaproteobacteria bacterium]|nr:response regulator [Deltaproteobacteria bacterium]
MSDRYTVLVVDDEKVIRDGCTLILQPEGYLVRTAANGREAIEILETEPVNVVLCDLKMPVMGAIEVLEEARERFAEVPIIIITGHGTVDDAVACMKKGAYDFVTKPFRIDHLTLCVRRALEKQLLERQARQLQEEQARNLYNLALEQSRLHTIVNCMADGVLVTNREMEVVLCNHTFTQLLGLNTPPPLPGPLSAYFDDAALKEAIQTLLAGGETGPNLCLTQEITRDRLHLRVMTAPFYGPDRETLGTVTVLHDITGFKELDRLKSDFVNLVSHELRSPLSSIIMQHKVILEGLAGDLTDKQREMLTRAHDKMQGLLDLINDLLDLAKIESGHRHLEQVPLDLGEVINEVAEFLRVKAEEQNISLEVSLPPELPRILADRRGIEEVFTNLLTNAIKYSPDGGAVRIAAVSHVDYVEAAVSDQGIGIEEDEIPKIFDKFYRVKHPKTRQVLGTGLGLAIVKNIIEAHRGSIKVESQLGKGTTFKVLLPAAAEVRSMSDARV